MRLFTLVIACSALVTACASAPAPAPQPTPEASAPPCTSLTWDEPGLNASPATFRGRLETAESTDANDVVERFHVLLLDAPVCLPDGAVAATEAQVYSMDPAVRAALDAHVGAAVEVSGPSFTGITAHHHRPIIVEVLTLAPAR